jgi:hypothetical protein
LEKNKLQATIIVGAALLIIVIPSIYPAIIHFYNPGMIFSPDIKHAHQGKPPPNV